MTTMISPSFFTVAGGGADLNFVTDFNSDWGLWAQYQGAGVNRLFRARDFTGAGNAGKAWSNVNVTPAFLSAAAPDGTLTACTLTETLSGNASRNIAQTVDKSAPTAMTVTLSVYAKAKERTRLVLVTQHTQTGSNAFAGFDLVGGQVAYTGTTAGTAGIPAWVVLNTSINDNDYPGTGWWRCRLTATTNSTVGQNRLSFFGVTIGLDSGTGMSAASRSYAGNGTSGLYIWGAKLSYGSALTSYLNSPHDDGTGEVNTLFIPAGTYDVAGQAFIDAQGVVSYPNAIRIGDSYPGCVIEGDGIDVTILSGQLSYASIAGYNGENGYGSGRDGIATAPRIASVATGATSVTLLDPVTHVRNFYVNQVVLLCAYDMQGYGQPINNNFFEWNRITGINTGTGVITLETPVGETDGITGGYKSTYPVNDIGNKGEPDKGGPAILHDVALNWDMDLTFRDLTITAPKLIQKSVCRNLTCERVKFPSGQVIPSQVQNFTVRDCEMAGGVEMDKTTELVWYDNVVSTGFVHCQSSSIVTVKVTDSSFDQLHGTGKFGIFSNSSFASLGLGPTSYGPALSATLNNVHVDHDQTQLLRNAAFKPLTWVFDTAAQTITMPQADGRGSNTLINMVPGCYLVPMMTGGNTCGPVFRVLDVTDTGTEWVFDIEGLPNPCPHILGLPWEKIFVHPCPDLTVTNTTTGEFAEMSFAAAAGRPWGAYYKKTTTTASYLAVSPFIDIAPSTIRFGVLEEIRITISTGYTGTGTLFCTPLTSGIGASAFSRVVHANGTSDITTLKVTVDLKTGPFPRTIVITPGSTTGTVGTDAITNNTVAGDWISRIDACRLSANITAQNPSVYPVFTVEVKLNHGI